MTNTLTILGLGPGNPSHRTLEASAALGDATRILLRTSTHPGLDDLVDDPRVATCDDLYESGDSFDMVYSTIVDRVLTAVSDGDLLFAVAGHPLVGERTVTAVMERAAGLGINVRIVPGISAVDVVSAALQVDPMAQQAQLVDATELQQFVEREPFNGSLPDLSPTRPVLLSQVYSRPVASAAKLALSRLFPDDHPITVVAAAGVAGTERVVNCLLFELDRVEVDHLTSVWIPALDELAATYAPRTLYRIAARLRAPDGCPWDRKQTYASLRTAVIEEAYEVAEAIDEGDPDHLAEELGDLQLLVAMHAQIAEEAGDFSIGDVYDHVNRKLVRRHPHVFGEANADTPEQVVQTWDAVKAGERAARGGEDPAIEVDPFDRLPKTMPVLHRVAKIARKRGVLSAGADAGALADNLLATVERLAAAGLDPEVELERAYRRRVTDVAAS